MSPSAIPYLEKITYPTAFRMIAHVHLSIQVHPSILIYLQVNMLIKLHDDMHTKFTFRAGAFEGTLRVNQGIVPLGDLNIRA
jgi:hypothetical protein